MSDYAINEYEWVPYEKGDRLPWCPNCEYSPNPNGANGKPCRGCEAINVREGEPCGRIYFKPRGNE